MKLRIALAAGLLAMGAMMVSGGKIRSIEDDFASHDSAAKVFALAEANSAEYQINLLQTGNIVSKLKPNIDLFEFYFPQLDIDEQFRLTLLILVTYDFDGEYGERFEMMTARIKDSFGKKVQELDRKRLQEFAERYHCSWKAFVDKCYAHFGVRL